MFVDDEGDNMLVSPHAGAGQVHVQLIGDNRGLRSFSAATAREIAARLLLAAAEAEA
jgi:hypothetical protein